MMGFLIWGSVCAWAFAGIEDYRPMVDHVITPREAIDLCSTQAWEFAAVTKGTKWDDPSIPWKVVSVPAHHYWNGIWGSEDPAVKTEGYFRRTFELTPEQAIRGGELHFELVAIWCDVWMNGVCVHQNRNMAAPFRCDVSEHLKPGTNTLCVNVYSRKRDGKEWPVTHGWAESVYFGISRPVHLELLGKTASIVTTRVETHVKPQKTILFETEVTNRTEAPVSVALGLAIENDPFSLSPVAVTIPAKASTVVHHEGSWPEAKLWSPAQPHLYWAKLTLQQGGRVLDAYRQRMGFRELSIQGNRILLNGHPFINRRDSVGLGETEAEARATIARLKARGVIGARVSSHGLGRDAKICDEEGFLLSVLPPTGGPYQRHDIYFSNVSNLVNDIVVAHRNHPSLIYWGLFNEFGPLYGVSTNQTPKCVEIGNYAMKLDPTRFYCSHGDAELGIKWGGPGPCPVRSLHYPINFKWGGNDFPEVAYWYANGKGSWQGKAPHDKPILISEDMYHGMNDVPRIMAKWQDDGIYELEGYRASWQKAFLMLAEGYYYGGISEWNPWFMNSSEKVNRMCDGGWQFMPDYLIATRHAYPNVASGSTLKEPLFVYNQSFATVKGTLMRCDFFQGKRISRRIQNLEVTPGGRWEGELTFQAPKVKTQSPEKYRVELTWSKGPQVLTHRVYEYNVLPTPETYAMPRRAVLVDYLSATNPSPVRALFQSNCIFTNADVVARLTTDAVVMLTGPIPAAEGKRVDEWVNRGGHAVALASQHSAWLPVSCNKRMSHAYAWRRNASFLPDIENSVWQVWRPNSLLEHVTLTKETALDMDILVDSFHTDGFTQPDVVRIPREKGGSWLVTSLPIEHCYAEEPAARYLVTRFMQDQIQNGHSSDRTKGYVFWGGSHPYATLFEQQGFPKSEVNLSQMPVALVDATQTLSEDVQAKILAYARQGGTVFLTETSHANRPILAKLGLRMRARGGDCFYQSSKSGHFLNAWGKRGGYEAGTFHIDGRKPFTDADRAQMEHMLETGGVFRIEKDCPENQAFLDQFLRKDREAKRDWFTRVGNPRVLDGISNADWFFSKAHLENIFRWELSRTTENPGLGLYSEVEDVSYGVLIPEPESKAEQLLNPGIFMKVPVGKGTVYVLTLKSDDIRGKYPRRYARLWRQMLGNLGVKASAITEMRKIWANERPFNSHVRLWANPETKDPAPVFFEDGDDLRYFPVNQCGWSLQAGNYCPVQPFPREPILLGGIPFSFAIPNHEKGGASVALNDAATWPPRGLERVKRIWILAALDQVPTDPEIISGKKPLIATFWHGSKAPEDVFWKYQSYAYYGQDIGAWRDPIVPKGNGCVAWEGPSGLAKKAALYAFPVENPFKPENGTSMVTIQNKSKEVKLAIFAVAWEEE